MDLLNKVIKTKSFNNDDFFSIISNPHIISSDNIKKFITFANLVLQQNQTLFLQLENLLKQATNNAKNSNLQNIIILRIRLFLVQNNLQRATTLINQLIKQFAPNLQIIKLKIIVADKLIENSNFDKANQYILEILHSTHIQKLSVKEQVDLYVKYLATLLYTNCQPTNILAFNNPEFETIKEYFVLNHYAILKQKDCKQLKNLLEKFKFERKKNLVPKPLINPLLELNIIQKLSEKNYHAFSIELIEEHLKNRKNTPINVQYMLLTILLPLLKNRNIYDYLNYSNMYFEISQTLIKNAQHTSEQFFNLTAKTHQLESSLNEIEIARKTDHLTRCLNRSALEEERIDYAKDNGAVVFFDLNDLKPINDSLGHLAGDEYLFQFASILKKHENDSVKAYRIGGDEFVLILKKYSKEMVTYLIEKIIKQCKKPLNILNSHVKVKCAVGIAMYPENGKSLKKLLKEADTAMYKSKTIKTFSPITYTFATK